MKARTLSEIWARSQRHAQAYIAVGTATFVKAGAAMDFRGNRAPATGFAVTEYDLQTGRPVDSFMTLKDFATKTESAETAAPIVPPGEFPAGTRVVREHGKNVYNVIFPNGDVTVKGHYALHTQFRLRASQLEGPDVEKSYSLFTRKDAVPLHGLPFLKDTPIATPAGKAEAGAVLLFSEAHSRPFLAHPALARTALRRAPK